jgi:RHS repeat-associated protein
MLRTLFTDDLPHLPTTFHFDAQGNRIPPDAKQDAASHREGDADELLLLGAEHASEDFVFDAALPADRYHYTGRELLAEEGLQYNRARCFDPSVGRWMSEDPLGYDNSEGELFPYPFEQE